MGAEFLVPSAAPSLNEWLGGATSRATTQPFVSARVDLIARWSEIILARAAGDPVGTSLAFWLRKASLLSLASQMRAIEDGSNHRVACGLTFTVAPANVWTMAAYSFAFSFLCGNASIVRVSPRAVSQLKPIIDAFVTAAGEQSSVWQSVAFVTYDRDDAVTGLLSSQADVRVLWGGDKTITEFRRHPTKITSRDIVFADRYSYAVLSAEAVNNASPERIARLARDFFNDAYWFDQMACSSPSALIWVGNRTSVQQASATFAGALTAATIEKRHLTPTGVALDKMTFAFGAVASGRAITFRMAANEVFLSQSAATELVREPKMGGGYFEELEVKSLDDIAPLVEKRDQTMTYFGFSYEALLALTDQIGTSGVDRIVPIGNALRFGRYWDGYDLLQEFTRVRVVEAEKAL